MPGGRAGGRAGHSAAPDPRAFGATGHTPSAAANSVVPAAAMSAVLACSQRRGSWPGSARRAIAPRRTVPPLLAKRPPFLYYYVYQPVAVKFVEF